MKMKINLPDELYFKILTACNNDNIPINEFIVGLFERHLNLQQSYNDLTQDKLDYFTSCLHQTIDEIVQGQIDLSESDEGTDVDKKMIEVLTIIFARATRDRMIMSECIDSFFNHE
ncbi:MAG: hypothetical protein ACTTKY_00640 [Catonella sp.]